MNALKSVCFIVLSSIENSEPAREELKEAIATLRERLRRWEIERVTVIEKLKDTQQLA